MSASHPPKSPKRANKEAGKIPIRKRRPKVPETRQAPEDDLPIESPIGDFVPVTLLLKYTAFVEHYLTTGDGVGAVRASKIAEEGASEQRCRILLRHTLNVPNVRQMMTDQYRSILAKTGATVERVWEEISYQAFLDPAVFYDAMGEVLPIGEMPENARRALTGMKVKTGTIGEDGDFTERELKYANKQGALEQLMRLHRMVDNDKVVIVDGDEWMRALQEGHDRAAKARAEVAK